MVPRIPRLYHPFSISSLSTFLLTGGSWIGWHSYRRVVPGVDSVFEHRSERYRGLEDVFKLGEEGVKLVSLVHG